MKGERGKGEREVPGLVLIYEHVEVGIRGGWEAKVGEDDRSGGDHGHEKVEVPRKTGNMAENVVEVDCLHTTQVAHGLVTPFAKP